MRELSSYIARINKINDYDLQWHWCGNGDTPDIEVYEEEDRHVLCVGDFNSIIEDVKKSLPAWSLNDPDN